MRHFRESGRVDFTSSQRLGARVSGPIAPVGRVGELFHPGHRKWPAGAEFAFGPNGHELTLFRTEIETDVVDDLRRGAAEFALIVRPPVIVLAYRFGESIPWADVPYTWHLQPEARRVLPETVVSPAVRALLWIRLVGADDGVLYAQRGMTLSPEFTRALHDAIRAQAMKPFDSRRCATAISSIYLMNPHTVDRLPIAQARTMGNA